MWLFGYLRALRTAATLCVFQTTNTGCIGYDASGRYDEDFFDDPPPAYAETDATCMTNVADNSAENAENAGNADADDHTPLGILFLCAKQTKFELYLHYVESPGVRLLIVGPDGPPHSRLLTDIDNCNALYNFNARERVRISSIERASTGDVQDTDGWTPTHVAIADALDDELVRFFDMWNQKLRFPSRNCFIAIHRRTMRLYGNGYLIVDVFSNYDIQYRLQYYLLPPEPNLH